MSYLQEYVTKIASVSLHDLFNEQKELIKKFNAIYDCEFIIYAASFEKISLIDISMTNTDYEVIYDLLRDKSGRRIFVYLETPGGSGQAAEDIAKILHSKFEEVNFIITGEAKSAGTILALSGDEIWMTKSGSLGPIDAQVKIGRSVVSAHNYRNWVERVKGEAIAAKKLNPFDAQMAAQISPGELEQVYNSLTFAIDLVKEWLPKYKFKNWKVTNTNGFVVTDEMRQKRAEEIANDLTNQDKWKSHGRSLKIQELDNIGLQINKIDDDAVMSDIIYRIQALNRVIFGSTPLYKVFVDSINRIGQNAIDKGQVVRNQPQSVIPQKTDWMTFVVNCRCGKKYSFYLKFEPIDEIDRMLQAEGHLPYPKDGKFDCCCGESIDLTGVKAHIESELGRPAVI